MSEELVGSALIGYVEMELDRIDRISRGLMSKVDVLSLFSTRTGVQLDYIALQFEREADVLRRRAQQLREKSHVAT